MLVVLVGYSFAKGLGVLGINTPVSWGLYIVNFVFWVGIGHAGTLISAILFLFRQRWRTSINRAAEAMTIFAVMVAAIFPLIHVGRPWFVFGFSHIQTNVDQYGSIGALRLLWDVLPSLLISRFLSCFGTWVLFLILPICATVLKKQVARAGDVLDNAILKFKQGFLSILSIGWVGSAKTWHHYEKNGNGLGRASNSAGTVGTHYRIF